MPNRTTKGSVYRQRKNGKLGTIWWIQYYVAGRRRPVRKSAHTSDRDEALEKLREEMGRSAAMHPARSNDPDSVSISQLLDLLIEDYKFEERNSAEDTTLRIEKHLRPWFGHMKARGLTTTQLKDYIRARRKVAAQATVNKELAFLRRAFRLGMRHEPRLVLSVPYFPIKAVDNARQGVLGYEQYAAIRDRLPSYARIALVIAYHTGARKGEIKSIQIPWINFDAARIELPGKVTKNKKARYLPIYGEMKEELQRSRTDAICEAPYANCPFLVQRNGERVLDFEKSWRTARKEAGVPEALFHDLRRTACTNMIDAGFTEGEAMEISGHLTDSVFRRYRISSKSKLKKQGERLGEYLETLKGKN